MEKKPNGRRPLAADSQEIIKLKKEFFEVMKLNPQTVLDFESITFDSNGIFSFGKQLIHS
jgi:hypothetical protein